MITIGQIGCGEWGSNLLRCFSAINSARVKYVAETSLKRREQIASNYKEIRTTADCEALFNDKEIDAVVIATPASDHYRHASAALRAGKHCLVEKPLALRIEEAQELTDLARKNKRILMVGHTFLYNSAVRKLKEEIDKGALGDIYYIYAQRLNLGRLRTDINAMWNFAPHDISICLFLLNNRPEWVSAIGASYVQPSVEDVVFMTMGFANGVIVHMHISWLDPNKIRRMTVVGNKRMAVYDDIAEDKIKIFDKGIEKANISTSLGSFSDFGQFQLIHRAGDVFIPKIDFVEPLMTETRHFVDCITDNRQPVSDGNNGLLVTRILTAAAKSLAQKGMACDVQG
jgi:predicted dehydrogenase